MQISACEALLCEVGEPFLLGNLEFISSMEDMNISIRSFSVEICSESCVTAPCQTYVHRVPKRIIRLEGVTAYRSQLEELYLIC